MSKKDTETIQIAREWLSEKLKRAGGRGRSLPAQKWLVFESGAHGFEILSKSEYVAFQLRNN